MARAKEKREAKKTLKKLLTPGGDKFTFQLRDALDWFLCEKTFLSFIIIIDAPASDEPNLVPKA